MKKLSVFEATLEAAERRRTLEMLGDINKWPSVSEYGKTVHVKRRKAEGGFPETGVIVETNVLQIMTLKPARDGHSEITERLDYKSFEEMTLDGWILD